MSDWRPTAKPDALRLRAAIYALIREFFAQRGVLEVETPVLSAHGTTDVHIESLRAEFSGHASAGAATRWLRTSPEFALKRLLAAGVGDCYELGRVFRNGEAGRRHNPEFTLLEWYRTGWDHHRLMAEAAALITAALQLAGRHVATRTTTYRDWFRAGVHVDPMTCDDDALRDALGDLRIDGEGLDRDDWLNLVVTHRLEPYIDPQELLLVHDYPATQSALARVRPGDPPVAERFEVYLGPVELANGYHELIDADEQGMRFTADVVRRAARGTAPHPSPDAHLLQAMAHGLPACSGVAMGIDRLLMAMTGARNIADVLAFPFDRA